MRTMSRVYFFRDVVDYTHEEMRNRIRITDVRNDDLDTVEALIERPDITNSTLGLPEEDLLSTLRNKLGKIDYERFIKNIFLEAGKKGDKFNLQFYFSNEIEYDDIRSNAESAVQDEDPEELVSKPTRQSLCRCKERGQGILDLRFVVGHRDLDTGVGVDDEDTESEAVVDPSYAEARIYTSEQVVAISNRGLDDKSLNSIRSTINRWTDGEVSTETTLEENELMAIQNALDGKNYGIDYGFDKNDISTASYRGTQAVSPSGSDIVRPATQNGYIKTLRFYAPYTNNGRDIGVLIRTHRDGHATASKQTEPEYIDELVEILRNVRDNADMLVSVDDRIGQYRRELVNRKITGNLRNYKRKMNLGLNNAMDLCIPESNREPVEAEMFKSVIFNIGIELVILNLSADLEDKTAPEYPGKRERLEQLFEHYAKFVLEDPNTDFEVVWGHLHSLLSGDYNSPIELIQTLKTQYNT